MSLEPIDCCGLVDIGMHFGTHVHNVVGLFAMRFGLPGAFMGPLGATCCLVYDSASAAQVTRQRWVARAHRALIPSICILADSVATHLHLTWRWLRGRNGNIGDVVVDHIDVEGVDDDSDDGDDDVAGIDELVANQYLLKLK